MKFSPARWHLKLFKKHFPQDVTISAHHLHQILINILFPSGRFLYWTNFSPLKFVPFCVPKTIFYALRLYVCVTQLFFIFIHNPPVSDEILKCCPERESERKKSREAITSTSEKFSFSVCQRILERSVGFSHSRLLVASRISPFIHNIILGFFPSNNKNK